MLIRIFTIYTSYQANITSQITFQANNIAKPMSVRQIMDHVIACHCTSYMITSRA